MKCAECAKSGLKSRVYVGMSTVTCMGWQPYYDEDGRHHSHDPNTHQTQYSCSNAHKWAEDSSPACWCGWGKK